MYKTEIVVPYKTRRKKHAAENEGKEKYSSVSPPSNFLASNFDPLQELSASLRFSLFSLVVRQRTFFFDPKTSFLQPRDQQFVLRSLYIVRFFLSRGKFELGSPRHKWVFIFPSAIILSFSLSLSLSLSFSLSLSPLCGLFINLARSSTNAPRVDCVKRRGKKGEKDGAAKKKKDA